MGDRKLIERARVPYGIPVICPRMGSGFLSGKSGKAGKAVWARPSQGTGFRKKVR